MAKDPAFLFYPGDWLGGTTGMTLEEKGAYLELLVMQFNKGPFTLQQAKKLLSSAFDRVWPDLVDKFTEVEGRFLNQRLDIEKKKRTINAQKNKERIEKYWLEKKGKNTTGNSNVYTKEVPIENENENVLKGESVRGEVVYNAEEVILANRMEFEKICMRTSKKEKEAKEALRVYHLYLEEKEQYPKGKRAVFSGFEKWLLNERKFFKGPGKDETGPQQDFGLRKISA